MNYGQFVRFAEKNWHLGADKLTQITVPILVLISLIWKNFQLSQKFGPYISNN